MGGTQGDVPRTKHEGRGFILTSLGKLVRLADGIEPVTWCCAGSVIPLRQLYR